MAIDFLVCKWTLSIIWYCGQSTCKFENLLHFDLSVHQYLFTFVLLWVQHIVTFLTESNPHKFWRSICFEIALNMLALMVLVYIHIHVVRTILVYLKLNFVKCVISFSKVRVYGVYSSQVLLQLTNADLQDNREKFGA